MLAALFPLPLSLSVSIWLNVNFVERINLTSETPNRTRDQSDTSVQAVRKRVFFLSLHLINQTNRFRGWK